MAENLLFMESQKSKCGKAHEPAERKSLPRYNPKHPDSYQTYTLEDPEDDHPFQRVYDSCAGLEALAFLLKNAEGVASQVNGGFYGQTVVGVSEILEALRQRIHDASAYAEDFYNCNEGEAATEEQAEVAHG